MALEKETQPRGANKSYPAGGEREDRASPSLQEANNKAFEEKKRLGFA